MNHPRFLLLAFAIVALGLTAGCASSPTSDTDDWAKSYAHPLDEVWSAAEEAVDARGFDIEDADYDRGHLRITSASTTIEMRFSTRGEIVLVDAFAASADQPGPGNMQRAGVAVESILNEISRILRERAE